METPVLIRRAGIGDADVLLQLSRTTFFEAFAHLNEAKHMEAYASVQFTAASIASQLHNQDSEFYFAFTDNHVAGYVKLNFGEAQTEFNDADAQEVERIYVLAAYQGRQIGKQLIDFAVYQAKLKQLKTVWLGVWEHNKRAIQFYKRQGFEVFSSHAFMLGDDRQVDLLMKLTL